MKEDLKEETFKKLMRERLEKAYKKELKSIKDHFKYDGWDLNALNISQSIIEEAVGVRLLDEYNIVRMARDLKIDLIYKKGSGFVLGDPNYTPVYYNGLTNELVEGEKQGDEWEYLGPL